MPRIRSLLVAAALGMVLAPSSSRAMVLYDNGLAIGSPLSNFASFSFTSTLAPYNQFRVADDFVLAAHPSGWSVTGVSFSGASLGGGSALVGASVLFDVLIYADDGGKPDAHPLDLPGSAFAHRQAAATGYDIGYGTHDAGFDVAFDGILLDGGTTYWLAVAARGAYTFDQGDGTGFGFAWWGREGTGNAYQGGTEFLNAAPGSNGWYAQDRQQEFLLTGAAIPEPSTFVVLAVGLLALGWGARRRR